MRSSKALLRPLETSPRAAECAVVQKTHDDCQERTQISLVRGSNREHFVQQAICLQLAADHFNSRVKTVSDFDALGQSPLLTASGDDSNEGKKIRVKIIFDPRDISTKFLLVVFVGNSRPPYFWHIYALWIFSMVYLQWQNKHSLGLL